MGHPSFACKSEGNGEHQRKDRKEKEEWFVYYCHEQEEKWKIMEAIVDTGCEATIIGEL